MNLEKQVFYEKYAPLAIEQQQKYGIPASVTLAQMYLESAGGKSRLSQECNNFFGIKVSASWLKQGKPYGVYNDDRPNEKFCKFQSVNDSVSEHSRVLMNKRYSRCHGLSSTDYEEWAKGISASGYASDPNYASSLMREIKEYGLDKYDRQAVTDAQQRGLSIGYMRGKTDTAVFTASVARDNLMFMEGNWSMPLAADNNKLVVTCDYGDTKFHKSSHRGIDLRANGVACYATEDQGVVTQAKFDKNGGGNFVCVEYSHPDGTKYEVEYLHLKEIKVDLGQQVNAGDTLGITGSTGSSTAPHLDFRVKKNGEWIDPKDYLAEIAVRGNMPTELISKDTGAELLASHKEGLRVGNDLADDQSAKVTQDDDNASKQEFSLENLLSSSLAQGGGGGIISNLFSMFLLMALTASKESLEAGVKDVSHDVPLQSNSAEVDDGVVMRKDGSLDPSKASETASMLFDTEYSSQIQQQQQQQVHLA